MPIKAIKNVAGISFNSARLAGKLVWYYFCWFLSDDAEMTGKMFKSEILCVSPLLILFKSARNLKRRVL